MTCPHEEAIVDTVMGDVSDAERSRVEGHAASCEHCRSLRESYLVLSHKLVAPPRKDPPASFTDSVMAKVRQMPVPIAAPPSPVASLGGWTRMLSALFATGLAAVFVWMKADGTLPRKVEKERDSETMAMSQAPGISSPLESLVARTTGQTAQPPTGGAAVVRPPEPPATADTVEIASVTGGKPGDGGSEMAGRRMEVGSLLHVSPGTRMEISWKKSGSFVLEGPASVTFAAGGIDMPSGRVSVDLHKPPGGFHVKTPQVEVRVVGTKFTVDSRENGSTNVAVERGTVEVENLADHVRGLLTEGHQSAYGAKSAPAATVRETGSPASTAHTPKPAQAVLPATETPGEAAGTGTGSGPADTVREGF